MNFSYCFRLLDMCLRRTFETNDPIGPYRNIPEKRTNQIIRSARSAQAEVQTSYHVIINNNSNIKLTYYQRRV